MAVTPQMTFEVPRVGAIIRKAMPRVIEGSVIPTALFTLALHLSGRPAAIVSALIWIYAVIALRLFRHRNVPGLLVMSASTLTARSAAALDQRQHDCLLPAAHHRCSGRRLGVHRLSVLREAAGRPAVARLPAGFTRDL